VHKLNKPAITSVPIHEIISNRWSGRAYDPEKLVDKNHLMAVLEAGRWAPSCFGEEPWRYLIWVKADNEDLWQKAFDCLVSGNQTWAQRAPVLMASFAHGLFSRNDKPNRWSMHDTGAASVSMAIQAVALGLMVHQMGGFDKDKLIGAFEIPENFTPMAMITLGWPGDSDGLPDRILKGEVAARERKPLDENFYAGEWGAGIT